MITQDGLEPSPRIPKLCIGSSHLSMQAILTLRLGYQNVELSLGFGLGVTGCSL